MLEYNDFINLCEEIAKIMECDFLPTSQISNRCEISNGNTISMYLWQQYNVKDKITISGVYPKDIKGHYIPTGDCSINVSEKKTAKQISSDIQKKFIPKYEKALAEVLKIIETSNRYEQNKVETISEISRHAGEKIDTYNIERGEMWIYSESKNFGSITFRHHSDKNLDIRIANVPIEKAKQIWDILQ